MSSQQRQQCTPHLLCPGWMTNTVPGLSKESDLSPPGDQAMGSGRQSCVSGPAQFLSVKSTTCQLRFNWAWYAGWHLCQQKWELWTCGAAEEFLILFWRVYSVVLLLSPARVLCSLAWQPPHQGSMLLPSPFLKIRKKQTFSETWAITVLEFQAPNSWNLRGTAVNALSALTDVRFAAFHYWRHHWPTGSNAWLLIVNRQDASKQMKGTLASTWVKSYFLTKTPFPTPPAVFPSLTGSVPLNLSS